MTQGFHGNGFERRCIAISAARHDVRHGYFAATMIRLAGNRCFRDLGLLHQELFDLARINIEAAGDDEVAAAAAQRVIAVWRSLGNDPRS